VNVGWGAPRIHGELLKLGIDISQRKNCSLMAIAKSDLQEGQAFLNGLSEEN